MRVLKEIDYTDPRRTYLITGCARSGTSILSGILHLNNIYMGEIDTNGTYEDVNFKGHFDQTKKLGNIFIRKNYSSVVKQRNKDHDEWGFKIPNLPHFFNSIQSNLINPVLIISFRNPLAVANSAAKYAGSWDKKHLDSSIKHNLLLLNLINSNPDIPCILSSFEEMMEDTEQQVKELETFLGKPLDLNIVSEFLSKKTYNYIGT